MKKIFCIVIAVFAFLTVSPSVARSQASFLFGMAVGFGLSDGGGNSSSGGATILYTASKDIMERIKEPLAVRQSSFLWSPNSNWGEENGLTFYQVFQKSLPKGWAASSYEILQIVRVFDGTSVQRAAIWFVYIEKSLLAPPVAKK